MSVAKRAYEVFRSEGMRGVVDRVAARRSEEPPELIDPYANLKRMMYRVATPFDQRAFEEAQCGDALVLNWVIPDPMQGSGGHINIFRFASMLEERGFHSRFYCLDSRFSSDVEARTFILDNFSVFDARMEAYRSTNAMTFAHGTIATQWTTAYVVRAFDNTLAKFYFVQDYEPYFYPRGTEYAAAELPYTFGFHAITAGGWLEGIMKQRYGLAADGFGFSYDKDKYVPHKREDDVKRVFFYARPTTPRRNFELGLYVLTELSKRIEGLEVIFAGGNLDAYAIQLPRYRCLDIMDPSELSNVYSQCDICLVFSYTNLSLLPLEIMASGSVVACSEGPNNEWLITEDNAILLDNDPDNIVHKLESSLNNREELDRLRDAGLRFARSTSWEAEGDVVAEALKADIGEKLSEPVASDAGKCSTSVGRGQ